MEGAKKERSTKAGMVTRRVNELLNAIKALSYPTEIRKKIDSLSYTMEELGHLHDGVIELMQDEETLQAEGMWYDGYDVKVNHAIREARKYMEGVTEHEELRIRTLTQVKLKKLELSTFNSDHRNYRQWKEQFDRYTKHLGDEMKYDYMLNYTKGDAHKMIQNKTIYNQAERCLEKEYGNENFIMKLLIDDIRRLGIVRKNDNRAFETLSREVNNFQDRLILMGKDHDVENTYVLQEIENKLNNEDKQKWLEHMGRNLGGRKVADICRWLEDQAHLRRLVSCQTEKGFPEYSNYMANRSKLLSNPASTQLQSCSLCNSDQHLLDLCPDFQRRTNEERWEIVKTKRLCFNCLSPEHRSFECTSAKCEVCQRSHHKLLHRFVRRFGNGDNNDDAIKGNSLSYDQNSCNSNGGMLPARAFLPIVRVKVVSGDKSIMVTTLLDSGSEIAILSRRTAKYLGLKSKVVAIETVGVGGVITEQITEKVTFIVEDKMGRKTSLEAIVLDKACGKALPISDETVDAVGRKLPINTQYLFTKGGEVDLLIGMGVPQLHKHSGMHGDGDLCIVETRFGPSLVGSSKSHPKGNYECSPFNIHATSMKQEVNLWEFLEAEVAGVTKDCPCQLKSDEEIKYENVMSESWTRCDDGRFEVKLPWKLDPSLLPNNRSQAIQRDEALDRQLKRKPGIERLFSEQIEDMIEKGILRKVDPDYPKRYLPLLAVTQMGRETTKVRVCLDAKSRFQNVSLNDALLKGKLKMPDIMQILTRFRVGEVAILGDLQKMFWQIKLHIDDQKYHGVVWRKNTYVFTRVCFGDKPSPPIAEESMIKIAQIGKDSHPEASKALIDKRYMDDIMDSSNDGEKIQREQNELNELLGQFGFKIKKWYSNKLMEGDTVTSTAILGCKWDLEKDILSPIISDYEMDTFTKRKVLSRIAEIWDPLGLCAGLLISARLVFQSIVRLKLEWDEPINDASLLGKWSRFLEEIEKCKSVVVNRNILPPTDSHVKFRHTLVGFCDGSNSANGGVVYLRWYNEDESIVKVSFVAAKGKLAPIRGITTPRNELCGAVLLARLTSSIHKALEKTELEVSMDNTMLLCDSTTVLSWIKADATRFKPFVKNKLLEIQDLTSQKVWRFIPSSRNKAADLISKGCNYEELKLIIEGPKILKVPERAWPQLPAESIIEAPHEELKVTEYLVSHAGIRQPVINLEEFPAWKKLIRVTAYVLRFLKQIVRRKQVSFAGNGETPSSDEIENAEKYWVTHAQKDLNVNHPAMKKLSPFADVDGVYRVYGRLKVSQLFTFDRLHPMILPKDSRVSRLILENIHNELFHPGHSRVVAESRKKYWIIGCRKIAKQIGFLCVTCRRWRRKACEQMMSNLPPSRLAIEGAPFQNCGVDYFGPLTMKHGRRARTKSYGVVFSCLTTRCVHIELATDISTDKFLLAFLRFISLYGQPKEVVSDNGKNFVGASSVIKDLIDKWKGDNDDSVKLRNFCAQYAVKWKFCTPLAPHHNGVSESMVKNVKTVLYKIIKGSVLSEEDYRTVFSEIGASINSRPLWPSSEGDIEEPPITCQDLLRPSGLITNPPAFNVDYDPRKRYQYIQSAVNEWWKLWLRNFLPNLQLRSKWYKPRENLEEGDVVLLIDPDIKRSCWSMGKVLNVYPGEDGKVRSVKVKTSKGVYDRPITKLCLLLAKKEYE